MPANLTDLLADLARRDAALTALVATAQENSINRERLTAKREGLRIAMDLVRGMTEPAKPRGEACRRCEGRGTYQVRDNGKIFSGLCSACNGTGVAKGAEVIRTAEVAE